ncbi:hypothetical protein [Lactobacillus taiwanensis]|uniref:hypothetical protein n=1 Tax=Lactobacillus taiwanensis TaxID=508451 RepID=UPI00321FFD73
MKTKKLTSVKRKYGLRGSSNISYRKNIFATDSWKNYDYQKAMKNDPEIADPQLFYSKRKC